MTVYVFHDFEAGDVAVFDNTKDLTKFFHDYCEDFMEAYGEYPEKFEDYNVTEHELNRNFKWWNNTPTSSTVNL